MERVEYDILPHVENGPSANPHFLAWKGLAQAVASAPRHTDQEYLECATTFVESRSNVSQLSKTLPGNIRELAQLCFPGNVDSNFWTRGVSVEITYELHEGTSRPNQIDISIKRYNDPTIQDNFELARASGQMTYAENDSSQITGVVCMYQSKAKAEAVFQDPEAFCRFVSLLGNSGVFS